MSRYTKKNPNKNLTEKMGSLLFSEVKTVIPAAFRLTGAQNVMVSHVGISLGRLCIFWGILCHGNRQTLA